MSWISVGLAADTPAVIEFSHDLHVADLEINCTKCHSPKLLKTSMSSDDIILPTEKRCLKCHKVWKEDGECEVCHLESEPYESFPKVDRNFNFPHKTHWVDQNIDCIECHGDMAGVENSPPIPLMEDCLSCHIEKQGPEYCSSCHENVAFLRPADHSEAWLIEHDLAALSNDSDCNICHSQNTCDNCHSGALLGFDDLPKMNPAPGYRPGIIVNKMLLSRNHTLDYVFSHGLEASTKAKDCSVCHEAPEFCTDCHQNEDDRILNKPDFHGGLDWGAVKYKYGVDFANNITGGVHAEMARKDIELCQSCHDVEGADPICVQCHKDSDGIQNTDPKTHATGFMKNVHGDWCTEPVSMCFVCHTPDSKGSGFCGYCHD
jgi:hypothetical protein